MYINHKFSTNTGSGYLSNQYPSSQSSVYPSQQTGAYQNQSVYGNTGVLSNNTG